MFCNKYKDEIKELKAKLDFAWKEVAESDNNIIKKVNKIAALKEKNESLKQKLTYLENDISNIINRIDFKDIKSNTLEETMLEIASYNIKGMSYSRAVHYFNSYALPVNGTVKGLISNHNTETIAIKYFDEILQIMTELNKCRLSLNHMAWLAWEYYILGNGEHVLELLNYTYCDKCDALIKYNESLNYKGKHLCENCGYFDEKFDTVMYKDDKNV